MSALNVFYAQSGGVTSVINASAAGVIEAAAEHRVVIGRVYAGRNGILGALREELIDTSQESDETIRALRHTPGGAFGSCRYKLKSPEENQAEYSRIIDVFKAHGIGYFFYNGGGDSQDTANKISEFSRSVNYPITCIGIPKTVDNDLPFTDCSPGFGSVARYVAVSTAEVSMDIASMCDSSTKVFVLEVMGRHAGWIAAASGLVKHPDDRRAPPHMILFPEVPFEEERFLERVEASIGQAGYCVVVASEGAQYADGRFLADTGAVDAFGHAQLGGVAPMLANLVRGRLGHKCHWSLAGYLQRAARHLASAVDLEQAYAVGRAAVEYAVAGKNSVMPTIVRLQDDPYVWNLSEAPLAAVANVEKKLPASFISQDGFGVTAEAIKYLRPLIKGEDHSPYRDGLPEFARLKQIMVEQKLPRFSF